MKSSAIILSLFLCTGAFAGTEAKPASKQAPEVVKAENPKASAAKKDAKADAAETSEKTYRSLVAPASSKESVEPAEPSKAELPVWLFEIEEKGNNVTFKKKTPFGVTSYSKPKNELTEEERDLVARYHAAKADGASTDDAKHPARPAMPIPKKQGR
jgi:hypothetical protein